MSLVAAVSSLTSHGFGPAPDAACKAMPAKTGGCLTGSLPRCQDELLSERSGFAKSANVTGGRGGKLYEVTSLEDDEKNTRPGTFRYGAEQGGYWIVFRKTGTIKLKSKLKVKANTTIDGRGAEVALTGFGLSVADAANVIINDISVAGTAGDGIGINGPATKGAWVHHVRFGKAGDESLAIKNGATDVTVSWSVLANQPDKSALISSAGSGLKERVTLDHLYWNGGNSRLPKIDGYRVHILNNFYDKPHGTEDVTCYNGCELLAEGNVYEPKTWGSVAMLDDATEGHGAGAVRSKDNLIKNFARIEEKNPEKVFDFSSAYSYRAETANDDLACRVSKLAGPRLR
jgi:pectate lyase